MQSVDINLKTISNVAEVGLRRAVLFMGLGLNAANREDFNDYELRKLPPMPGQTAFPLDFFPSGLPADRVKTFKAEFALWIVACGFRELLEHYALFLDSIHNYCLLVLDTRGKLGNLDPKKAQAQFYGRLGIPDKLDTLNRRFSVATSDTDSIKQLYAARNCLTHDLGVVRPNRCDHSGQFLLSWRAFDLIAHGEESGVKKLVPEIIGHQTTEAMTIEMHMVKRERKFATGSKLELSQQDLWEICFFFRAHAIPSALKSFAAFLQAHNVPPSPDKSGPAESANA